MKVLLILAVVFAVALAGGQRRTPKPIPTIPLPSDVGDNDYGNDNGDDGGDDNGDDGSDLEGGDMPDIKTRPLEKVWKGSSSGKDLPLKDVDTKPSQSYGSRIPNDAPSSYGSKPLPPKDSTYGSKVTIPPHNDIPAAYGSKPSPKPDTYGSRILPKDTKPFKPSVPINFPRVPETPEIPEDVPEIPSTGTCKKSSLWLDVVGCYQCEIDKCVDTCRSKNQLPPAFDECYKETALSQIKTLFTDCLGGYGSKLCVKLPENMALNFLRDHYSRSRIHATPNDDCILECSLPGAMGCMSECEHNDKAVKSSAIMVCYKQLKPKIDGMLTKFANCVDEHAAPPANDDSNIGGGDNPYDN